MAGRDLRIRVDHVGIAVEDRAAIVPVLEAMGGELLADEPAPDGYRWIQYAVGDASRIELIEPAAADTFLTDYLSNHGPGLHHVTFEVANLDDMVAHLEEAGVSIVDVADRHRYREAFVPPRETGGVLFQLMEFDDGYCEAYGEPGVGPDLVIDDTFRD